LSDFFPADWELVMAIGTGSTISGSDAINIFNDVRSKCPVATTERYGRAFMPVTMEAVSDIAHDTEHFSFDGPQNWLRALNGCPMRAGEQVLVT
jgi:hypothetical protein